MTLYWWALLSGVGTAVAAVAGIAQPRWLRGTARNMLLICLGIFLVVMLMMWLHGSQY
jgi:hypothetical protein